MFDFFKKGIEFQKLAEAFNGMNVMILQLTPEAENDIGLGKNDESLLMLAYIAKKGVIDRIDKFGWSPTSQIHVPTLDRNRITLAYAMMQTVGKLSYLADCLEMNDVIDDIINGGESFWEVERNLPDEIKSKI